MNDSGRYMILPPSEWKPSAEVLSLLSSLNDHLNSREYSSDWGRNHAKYLRSSIRRERLRQAREQATHTAEEWVSIVAEFDGRCVRCGVWPDPNPCKDHILPIYCGGSDGIDNLQPLCRECNTAKGPDSFNWAAYRRDHGFPDNNGVNNA